MRLLLIGAAALALSACDSGKVPSPADRQSGAADVVADVDLQQVTLRGDGLTSGAESFFFAAGETEVKTALTASLGEASDTGENSECGAGPMAYANYPGGLTVNFQNGSLVGWVLQGEEDTISVSADVEIGTPRAEAEALERYIAIEDSTLGEEFVISGDLAGFIEDDAVSMLYSGVQCFFR